LHITAQADVTRQRNRELINARRTTSAMTCSRSYDTNRRAMRLYAIFHTRRWIL